MMENLESVFEMEKEALIKSGIEKGLRPFQAKECYVWLYNRRVNSPEEWSSLPKTFRKEILNHFDFSFPQILKESVSKDGTTKLLLQLNDKMTIEAVYIPQGKRNTLCISSQVGCPVGCSFCLTGKGGFIRNLTASEIFLQIVVLEKRFSLFGKHYNIVVMGMGEPLLNLDNFKKSLKIILDPEGLAISRRRITVSTVGIKGKLEEYLKDTGLPPIAISLHSAIEERRRKLIPSRVVHSVKEIREILQKSSRKEREKISIEYVIIKDFNDSKEDAEALKKFCKGLKVKVNLIPFNQNKLLNFSSPEKEKVIKFQDILSEGGISTTIRKSRGEDINAACGLLSTMEKRKAI